MAQSIYDDSNPYWSVSDQVSECSSWTISQKFALFGQIHFRLKCGLSIGWVIITREDEPPHPPHYSNTQLQLSCSLVQFQIIMLSSFNYSGVTLSPDLGIWALFSFVFVYIEVLCSLLFMENLCKYTLEKFVISFEFE